MSEYKYVGTIFSSNTQDNFKNNKAHLALNAQTALFALNDHINIVLVIFYR